jgi:hypothetical protein
MRDAIQSILASTLLRTLQVEPSLAPSDALVRIKNIVQTIPFFPSDSVAVHQFLQDVLDQACCRGVINPIWLSQAMGIDLYFYLIRTEPGWLQFFEGQTKSSAQLSYYVLYGDWDVLIAFHGSKEEAATLLESITTTAPYDCIAFSILQYHWFHHHRTCLPSEVEPLQFKDCPSFTTEELINAIINNYNDPVARPYRDRLEKAGVLLGSTWKLDLPSVRAYIGIDPRGPIHRLTPQQLLDDLLQDEVLRPCLLHFADLTVQNPSAI